MKVDPRDDNNQCFFYEVFLGQIVTESKLKDYPENKDCKYRKLLISRVMN